MKLFAIFRIQYAGFICMIDRLCIRTSIRTNIGSKKSGLNGYKKTSSKNKIKSIPLTASIQRGTTLYNSVCVCVCQGTMVLLYVSHHTILVSYFFLHSTYNETANTQFLRTIFLHSFVCTTYIIYLHHRKCIEIHRQNAFGIQLILLGRAYFNMYIKRK